MRPTLASIAIVLLGLLVSGVSSSSQPRVVTSVGRADAEPDGADGRAPLERTTGTAAEPERPVANPDFVTPIAEKGVLGLLLLAVLWQYRRDFFRKDEKKDEQLKDERERSDRLEEVLGASTAANTNSAVATARQTDATHRLARAVENIERRQAGLPPTGQTPKV